MRTHPNDWLMTLRHLRNSYGLRMSFGCYGQPDGDPLTFPCAALIHSMPVDMAKKSNLPWSQESCQRVEARSGLRQQKSTLCLTSFPVREGPNRSDDLHLQEQEAPYQRTRSTRRHQFWSRRPGMAERCRTDSPALSLSKSERQSSPFKIP